MRFHGYSTCSMVFVTLGGCGNKTGGLHTHVYPTGAALIPAVQIPGLQEAHASTQKPSLSTKVSQPASTMPPKSKIRQSVEDLLSEDADFFSDAPLVVKHVQGSSDPWNTVLTVVPDTPIGQYISQQGRQGEEFCSHNLNFLERGAGFNGNFRGVSPYAIFKRISGDGLLDLVESTNGSSCHHEAIVLALKFLTSIPGITTPGFDYIRFSRGSDLMGFCARHEPLIKWNIVFNGGEPWAMHLPLFCPDIFDGDSLRAAIQHLALRQKLDNGYNQQLGIAVQVDRDQAFSQTFRALNSDDVWYWSNGMRVVFANEEGYDAGGLTSDFFAEVMSHVFDPESTDTAGGLFKKTDKGYFFFNDAKRLSVSRSHYEAFGRLLAVAIALGDPIRVPLPNMFFAKLLNEKIQPEDLAPEEEGKSSAYASLLRNPEHIGDGFELDVEELGKTLLITPANYETEIQRAVDSFFSGEAGRKMDRIRAGFNFLIPVKDLKLRITAAGLKRIINGEAKIDIAEMKRNAVGELVDSNAKELKWIFDWLDKANVTTRRKFLRFVTGSSQVPNGGFTIRPITFNWSEANGLAPHSHTCTFTIDVPKYSSAAQLEEWFTASVASSGFGIL